MNRITELFCSIFLLAAADPSANADGYVQYARTTDSLWVEKRDYCVVEVRNDAPFLNQDYNQTLYYWVPRGEPIEGLPGYEQEGYRFLGYRDRDTGQIVSDGAVIGKDCILEAEWEIEQ